MIGVLVVAASCDSGGSKRDSLYQQLTGRWQAQRLHLNGGAIALGDTVRFEFEQRDGRRTFRIVQVASDDTTQAGRVDVPRSNVLSMTTGFARPLLWQFDFDEPDATSTSVRLRLQSNWQGSAQAVLAAIGIGGGAQTLAIDLERE